MSSLVWLFTIAGLVSLDARTINPVLPAIATSLAATPGQAGYAATAYTIAYGALQLFWGPFADRYGRIRAVRIATLAFAAGALVSALATTVGEFVGARPLTGLFAAATIPTTYAYIGDTVRYEARLHTIGRFSAMMSSAQALSSAVASAVTLVVSWRLMFAGYAALAVLCVLPLFRVKETARAASALERVSYATILSRPAARRVYLAAFGEGFFVWGGTTYLGVVAYRRLGFNEFQSGVLLGCYGLGTVLGGITLPRVSGRFGERG